MLSTSQHFFFLRVDFKKPINTKKNRNQQKSTLFYHREILQIQFVHVVNTGIQGLQHYELIT